MELLNLNLLHLLHEKGLYQKSFSMLFAHVRFYEQQNKKTREVEKFVHQITGEKMPNNVSKLISAVMATPFDPDYFAAFPQVIRYIESQKELARQKGYAETLFGRKRYLPDIHSHNATVRSFAERNAVNAPIQGTAADIIKMAMVSIHRRLKEENLQTQMIMQVHDELNFNVPIAEVDRVREIVVSEMQNAVHLSIPLIAECGVGENWLVAH